MDGENAVTTQVQSKQQEEPAEQGDSNPDGEAQAPTASAGGDGDGADSSRSRKAGRSKHLGFAYERRCQERSLQEFS